MIATDEMLLQSVLEAAPAAPANTLPTYAEMYAAMRSGDLRRLQDMLLRQREFYRGAQYGRAGNGDEFLRLRALVSAGQDDMFGSGK